MKMNWKEFAQDMLTPGTRACMLFGTLIGLVFAVLWLTIGFAKTLLIGFFCLAGAFIGGVPDKIGFIKKLILRFRSGNEEDHYE